MFGPGKPAYSKIQINHLFILEQMKPGVFREEYIAIIVRELLRGLEYLHSEGKLHRDIKGRAKRHYLDQTDFRLRFSCEHPAFRRR